MEGWVCSILDYNPCILFSFLQIHFVMRLVTKAKTCIIDVGTNVLVVLIILVLAEVTELLPSEQQNKRNLETVLLTSLYLPMERNITNNYIHVLCRLFFVSRTCVAILYLLFIIQIAWRKKVFWTAVCRILMAPSRKVNLKQSTVHFKGQKCKNE